MAKKETNLSFSKILMGGAILAVIFSAIGAVSFDIYLASTQWLLVAAVLAAFGIYFKIEENR